MCSFPDRPVPSCGVYSYGTASHSLGVALHSGSGGLCRRCKPTWNTYNFSDVSNVGYKQHRRQKQNRAQNKQKQR